MNRLQRALYLGVLILAGESIYMLPLLRKTFQTSMESIFEVSNTELGVINSMYGILAMICYFPGGWLADQFSSRKLLTFSLLSTGLLGLYLTTYPGYVELLVLHGLWGITTILTFWAALIKATRSWGDRDNQGTTFGLLDGGRGLTAGLLASVATSIFAASQAASTEVALRNVIFFYSFACVAAGIATWFLLEDDARDEGTAASEEVGLTSREKFKAVLSLPQVWLQALIVFAAYWLYVTTFDFPAFAEKAFEQDKVFGATLGTFRDWMRPIAAIGAGLLADRLRATQVIGACFVVLGISYGCLAVVPTEPSYLWLLWIEVAAIAACVFALRGIYYALLEESRVPMLLTGTAVGVVSVMGYLPDAFSYPLIGWFVDTYGPESGYQAYFGIMVGIAVLGLTGSALLRRVVLRQKEAEVIEVSPDSGNAS